MKNAFEKSKFTWGDTAVVKKDAPMHFHPGEIVAVCSVIKIDSKDVIEDPLLIDPSWLYTVEFADGSSIEISEFYLEKYQEP